MNRSTAIAIALSFGLVAGPAYAEPPVTPLYTGAQAGFDGFLVPEGRMSELLKAEVDAEELDHRLKAKAETCKSIQKIYVAKLKEATASPAWYETPSFNRWAGFALGVIATGAAVGIASKVTN